MLFGQGPRRRARRRSGARARRLHWYPAAMLAARQHGRASRHCRASSRRCNRNRAEDDWRIGRRRARVWALPCQRGPRRVWGAAGASPLYPHLPPTWQASGRASIHRRAVPRQFARRVRRPVGAASFGGQGFPPECSLTAVRRVTSPGHRQSSSDAPVPGTSRSRGTARAPWCRRSPTAVPGASRPALPTSPKHRNHPGRRVATRPWREVGTKGPFWGDQRTFRTRTWNQAYFGRVLTTTARVATSRLLREEWTCGRSASRPSSPSSMGCWTSSAETPHKTPRRPP